MRPPARPPSRTSSARPVPPAKRRAGSAGDVARMSLDRKALNSPSTIAICCSEARRPRMRAGATSEIYIGANTLAPPMARPPRIREAMKKPAEPAAPAAKCARQKKNGVQQHRWAPAINVGDGPCEEGADSATKQHRSNGKARGRRPGAEGVRQGVYGTVDNAAVETEEKAADRGHRAQHDYISRANWDGIERRGSACRRRYAPGQVSLDTFYWFIHSKVFFSNKGCGTPRSKVDPGLEADHDCV